MANADDTFTHFLVLRFECCNAVYVHNQYRVCNIGIVVDECACRVTERPIRLYVACTTVPCAPRVHIQVLEKYSLRLKRDFTLRHTLWLCAAFKKCYVHDSTKPVCCRQKRFTEWLYVILARLNLDDDDDDDIDDDYDDSDVTAFMSPREYDLRFAAQSAASSEDRSFLYDLLGSVATTFYFNVARVVVLSRYERVSQQPLRFVVHSDVHEPYDKGCAQLRHKWILFLGNGDAPDAATRLMWRSALPREKQYRGPHGEDAFVYSARYKNEFINSTWLDRDFLSTSNEREVTSDPIHIITANMTGERIYEVSQAERLLSVYRR